MKKQEMVVYGLLLALSVLVVRCSAVALTQYKAQLKACDDNSTTREEDDKCKAEVRARWDEAGAPKAAALDGGAE